MSDKMPVEAAYAISIALYVYENINFHSSYDSINLTNDLWYNVCWNWYGKIELQLKEH